MRRHTFAFVGLLGAAAVLSPTRAFAQDANDAPKRVIVAPKLVKFVEAEFPESEKAAEKGAAVMLQIAIRETGEVAGVGVVASAGPAFDAAAIAAAKQFVFTPATVD